MSKSPFYKTGINIKTVSSICQKPGIFITMHKDMFYAIKSREDTTNKHLVLAAFLFYVLFIIMFFPKLCLQTGGYHY